jgi:hypothetical protein
VGSGGGVNVVEAVQLTKSALTEGRLHKKNKERSAEFGILKQKGSFRNGQSPFCHH